MNGHLRLVAVSACLLIFGGCDEKEVEVPISEVAEPFPETTPPPTTPEPEVVAEATSPPEPRFLPEGEFVIVKRVSVVTDAGIVGAAPGTRVRLVTASDSAMIVTTGHTEFEVTPEHVTNDLNIIEALDAGIAARRPAAPPAGGQTVSFQQPRPDMPPPPPVAPDAAARAAADFADRRQKLDNQIEQADHSIRAMRDKLRELNDQQFRGLKSIHGSFKASQLARDRNTPEESRINGLLQKAEAQRNALDQQRRNLK